MSDNYAKSGVNLQAGYDAVERIKKHIEKTKIPGVLGDIGSFGGLFDLGSLQYKHPILVSSTDGVGTKLKIAIEQNKHNTIGIDAVAMCVNDILALGAKPLFLLDYIAVGKNNPVQIEEIVSGIANGCLQSMCALIGGETAEMPDMYQENDYDIAAFSVGIVEKDRILDGSKVEVGDVVIGLPSSGLHSNGYSLVRKILFKDHHFHLDEYFPELNNTLANALLTPTKIYVKPVLAVLNEVDVCGIAHITGGGFYENMPRSLKENQGIEIKRNSYPIPCIFKFLQQLSKMSDEEMHNVFNMGIGMILIVKQEDVNKTMQILINNNENAYIIGKISDKLGVHFYD
ncbi:phosphoribosylformylglycinamidine cyclo-ligase [Erysipelotrichaceae bacterium OH741_COT-311]|nr:phosphoribosylformylglycinamidine cyclo-ligase [Erysipelotrichaceae bacterium OH741_COT-311]